MTVSELIVTLQGMKPGAKVCVWTCDASGDNLAPTPLEKPDAFDDTSDGDLVCFAPPMGQTFQLEDRE